MNNYRRPADYQINHIYKCGTCGTTREVESCYEVGPCVCGNAMDLIGETYPADSADWVESGDSDDWRSR